MADDSDFLVLPVDYIPFRTLVFGERSIECRLYTNEITSNALQLPVQVCE
jgi:hypothetical protein